MPTLPTPPYISTYTNTNIWRPSLNGQHIVFVPGRQPRCILEYPNIPSTAAGRLFYKTGLTPVSNVTYS
jgi:hypothetical protein